MMTDLAVMTPHPRFCDPRSCTASDDPVRPGNLFVVHEAVLLHPDTTHGALVDVSQGVSISTAGMPVDIEPAVVRALIRNDGYMSPRGARAVADALVRGAVLAERGLASGRMLA